MLQVWCKCKCVIDFALGEATWQGHVSKTARVECFMYIHENYIHVSGPEEAGRLL